MCNGKFDTTGSKSHMNSELDHLEEIRNEKDADECSSPEIPSQVNNASDEPHEERRLPSKRGRKLCKTNTVSQSTESDGSEDEDSNDGPALKRNKKKQSTVS